MDYYTRSLHLSLLAFLITTVCISEDISFS